MLLDAASRNRTAHWTRRDVDGALDAKRRRRRIGREETSTAHWTRRDVDGALDAKRRRRRIGREETSTAHWTRRDGDGALDAKRRRRRIGREETATAHWTRRDGEGLLCRTRAATRRRNCDGQTKKVRKVVQCHERIATASTGLTSSFGLAIARANAGRNHARATLCWLQRRFIRARLGIAEGDAVERAGVNHGTLGCQYESVHGHIELEIIQRPVVFEQGSERRHIYAEGHAVDDCS